MALDLGTATIIAGLANLDHLHIPNMTKIANSQTTVALESDVRLAYCRGSNEQLQQMQNLIRKDIGDIAHKLCRR